MTKFVINATNHIAGRIASKIAKHLLEGHEVTVLFAENIRYAFPIVRAKKIYEQYLRKRCVVNPNKGVYHYVEPSKYFTRMVKRMLPHKKTRGANALKRLTVHESCPEEYFDVTKSVIPEAMLEYKSNPIRKNCTFGELLKTFGWKHSETAKEINDKYEEEKQRRDSKQNEKEKKVEAYTKSKEFVTEVQKRLAMIE
ncbi:Component of cytosolic 80S ribosome and 60S large subunit [Binucleata daphniae]